MLQYCLSFALIHVECIAFRTESDLFTFISFMKLCDAIHFTKFDALRGLVSFLQFKKREKHPWRSVTLIKVNSSMGVFHVFKILQMVPNRAKYNKLSTTIS